MIILTAAGGWPRISNPCADPLQIELATNDINLYVADFDPDTSEYMQWVVVMPSDWDAGTVLAYFYWMANTTSTNSVVWYLTGRSYADGDALDQAMAGAQGVVDANTGQNQLNISGATGALTIAGGPAANELIVFEVYRNGAHGSDTLTSDARLIAVRVTFSRS